MRKLLAVLSVLSASVFAGAIDTLSQRGPGGSLSLVAVPKSPGKHAALVLAPEWWGLNAYSIGRARQFAEEGYVVLALDLYGGRKVVADPKQAGELAGAFYADRTKFRESLRWAVDSLSHRTDVDSSRIGALGFCFGGTAVLEGARAGLPLKLVGSFHGGVKPGSPTAAGAVKGKVMVFHGGADPHVTLADVGAFVQDMEAAKADYSVLVLPHAVHAFTNPAAGNDPSKGMAYDPAAERESFAAFHRGLEATGLASR
jgi:dienelactone hydrolase